MSRRLLRTNALALAVTLAATAVSAALCDTHRGLAAATVFTLGHFAWSAYLAAHVARTGGLRAKPPPQ